MNLSDPKSDRSRTPFGKPHASSTSAEPAGNLYQGQEMS
jgi:hypothetical protein